MSDKDDTDHDKKEQSQPERREDGPRLREPKLREPRLTPSLSAPREERPKDSGIGRDRTRLSAPPPSGGLFGRQSPPLRRPTATAPDAPTRDAPTPDAATRAAPNRAAATPAGDTASSAQDAARKPSASSTDKDVATPRPAPQLTVRTVAAKPVAAQPASPKPAERSTQSGDDNKDHAGFELSDLPEPPRPRFNIPADNTRPDPEKQTQKPAARSADDTSRPVIMPEPPPVPPPEPKPAPVRTGPASQQPAPQRPAPQQPAPAQSGSATGTPARPTPRPANQEAANTQDAPRSERPAANRPENPPAPTAQPRAMRPEAAAAPHSNKAPGPNPSERARVQSVAPPVAAVAASSSTTSPASSAPQKPVLVTKNDGLVVQSLGKQFKKRPVLRDVSLRVQRGEAVGLLGPNGAGKTTCFYIVTGLIPTDYGQILLDGVDITDVPMYRRSRLGIGYLPQESSIFRGLTVEQNIIAVLELIEKNREKREATLEALLAEFSITHLRRTPAIALSGGERRRLEIARALASQPNFVLLDEPLAGIDPIAVRDIRQLVSHLKDRGIGVLITDHNVRETLDIVDRAYILHDGHVLMDGTPDEIVANQEVRRVYLGDRFSL